MTRDRVLILICILYLVFATWVTVAQATTVYVDLATGDDGTGTGAWDNPYATIKQGTTGLTGGDEVRVAKTAVTTLSGTLTFTNGSTSVSTSADLTGDLAAGDFVGLNATDESWWMIASLTSSVITLSYQYWGPGTGVASTGYTPVPVEPANQDESIYISASGTSAASRLKVSGGWTLSTQTQDGITFYDCTGIGTLDPFYSWQKSYFEIADLIVATPTNINYNDMYFYQAQSIYLHDLIVIHGNIGAVNTNVGNEFMVFEDIIASGGEDTGINISANPLQWYENITLYSIGTGINDYGINVTTNPAMLFFKNVKIYNNYYTAIYITNDITQTYFEDIVIDTTRYAGSDGLFFDSSVARFSNLDMDNVDDDCIYMSHMATGTIHNFTCDANGDDEIYAYHAGTSPIVPGVAFSKYGGVDGDDRIYFVDGYTNDVSRIVRDTTDARSGACMKFYAFDSNGPIIYEVGTAQATSGGEMTLSVYMKDNAGFDGRALLYATIDEAVVVVPTEKTMTTSYVQQSITVDAADVSAGDWVKLWVSVMGTAGNVFVDDFSFSD